MSDHFNSLNPAQAERLAMLAEEAGEIVQMVGKVLRHGYGSKHPRDLMGLNNEAMLAHEIGDLIGVVRHMRERGDIDGDLIDESAADKMRRAALFMHHAEFLS